MHKKEEKDLLWIQDSRGRDWPQEKAHLGGQNSEAFGRSRASEGGTSSQQACMNCSFQRQLRNTEGRIPTSSSHRAAAVGSLEFQECTGHVLEQWLTGVNEANAVPATFQQGKCPGSWSYAEGWIWAKRGTGRAEPTPPGVLSTAPGLVAAAQLKLLSHSSGFIPYSHTFGSRNPSRKLPTFALSETELMD